MTCQTHVPPLNTGTWIPGIPEISPLNHSRLNFNVLVSCAKRRNTGDKRLHQTGYPTLTYFPLLAYTGIAGHSLGNDLLLLYDETTIIIIIQIVDEYKDYIKTRSFGEDNSLNILT